MTDHLTLQEGGMTVRIDGLKDLQKALRKTAVDVQDQKDLMHSIGDLVVNAAKPKTPEISGTLRNTIRAGRGKTKAVVRAGSAKAPYAGVIHYGWPAHNIKPHPFLTDALSAEHAAIFEALGKGLQELLDKNGL